MPNLHEYLDQLEVLKEQNTQYYVRCPYCEGKIALSKNPPYRFQCVTNGCSARDIFSALGIRVSSNSNQNIRLPISPIYLNRKIKMNIINEYELPLSYEYRTHDFKIIKRTEYNYGNTHRIIRNDIYSTEDNYMNDVREEKTFMMQYKDNNRWVNGKGRELYGENIPLFNEKYLLHGTDLIIVEGEKCAVTFTTKLGYLACTIPGSCWSENYTKTKLSNLFHVIGGLVIIPDIDKPGLKKAKLLCEVAWQLQIPTKIIDISKFVDEDEDIADLINNYPEDTKRYIEQYA